MKHEIKNHSDFRENTPYHFYRKWDVIVPEKLDWIVNSNCKLLLIKFCFPMILFVYSRELAGSMKKKHLIIPDVIFDKNVLILFKV